MLHIIKLGLVGLFGALVAVIAVTSPELLVETEEYDDDDE